MIDSTLFNRLASPAVDALRVLRDEDSEITLGKLEEHLYEVAARVRPRSNQEIFQIMMDFPEIAERTPDTDCDMTPIDVADAAIYDYIVEVLRETFHIGKEGSDADEG